MPGILTAGLVESLLILLWCILYRTSLLVEMEVLSVGWEAKIRGILFWHRILTDQQYHHYLVQWLAHAALRALGRGQ